MKKNLLFSTFYQILLIIAPILTTPYVSRVLCPEGIGVYSYTSSIVTYFTMFATLGTASYGSREIARHRNDPQTYSKLFWEIELLTVVTTTVSLSIWLLWCCFNESYRIYYLILCICIISVLFDISWFYAGLEEFQYTVLANTLFKILGVICVFVLVKQKEDLGLYIAIMSAVTLLGNISMWIYLPRFLKHISFSHLHILRHLRETMVYFIPTIATSVYAVLDKTLIGTITENAYESGVYEQASKLLNMACSVTFTALNKVFGVRTSWLYVQKKYEEIREYIDHSIDYVLFMGMGICFGILGVADSFVPLFFGEGYGKVITLLKVLSPLVIIIGVSNCLGSQYYTPAGLRAKSAKYLIVGAVVNLVFNCIMIPRFTSTGAVVATLLAESVITILYVKNSNNYVRIKDIVIKIRKKIIAGIVMFSVIYQMNSFQVTLGSVIFQIVCGVIIYVSALLVLKDSFVVWAMKLIRKQNI